MKWFILAALLAAPVLGESVTTQWGQSSDPKTTNYTVLYYDTAKPSLVRRVHTTSTTAVITNLVTLHAYVFRVAVNSSTHGSATMGTVTYVVIPSDTPAILFLALPPGHL